MISLISASAANRSGNDPSNPTKGTTRIAETYVCTAAARRPIAAATGRGRSPRTPPGARRRERLALVDEPAGERHLAGVPRERVGADREDQGRLRRLDDQREDGGQAVARRRRVRRRRIERGAQGILEGGRV